MQMTLWNIFCEYCSKKKKLPNYEKPKQFFGFQVTKSSASHSTITNDEGEKFYHKLILSYPDVIKLMEDFDLLKHFE